MTRRYKTARRLTNPWAQSSGVLVQTVSLALANVPVTVWAKDWFTTLRTGLTVNRSRGGQTPEALVTSGTRGL